MARLIIRKIKYEGDHYYYESPVLKNGLNILAAPNGTGKTTFAMLISYGLGNNVNPFAKKGTERHREIANDTNNYVTLQIEINGQSYFLTRWIGKNEIRVSNAQGEVKVYAISRRRRPDAVIFSDWLLKELHIEAVEILKGNRPQKINFTDLFRLMYYDQLPNPGKIYKKPESADFYPDTKEVRKAIFQLFMENAYAEYYQLLSKKKAAEKEKNVTKAIIDELSNVVRQLGFNNKNTPLEDLQKEANKLIEQIEELLATRANMQNGRPSSVEALSKVEMLKAELLSIEFKLSDLSIKEKEVYSELRNLHQLRDNLVLESTQIQKIIFTHEKLNLFAPDNCPYCLKDISKENGRCSCQNNVEENQYERFFYDQKEYTDILKTKQNSIKTTDIAIESCKEEVEDIKREQTALKDQSQKIKDKIRALVQQSDTQVDVNYLNGIDDKILKKEEELQRIRQQMIIQQKTDQLQKKLDELTSQLGIIKNELETKKAQADQGIKNKLDVFNRVYNQLIKAALDNAVSASINAKDYTSVINDGDYQEASASVPKKLMYFLTMFYMSLCFIDVKVPKFLLIDTPETAGIDGENLIKCLEQISSAVPKGKKFSLEDGQIILTTGLDKYPAKYQDNVFQTLDKTHKLLIKKT